MLKKNFYKNYTRHTIDKDKLHEDIYKIIVLYHTKSDKLLIDLCFGFNTFVIIAFSYRKLMITIKVNKIYYLVILKHLHIYISIKI